MRGGGRKQAGSWKRADHDVVPVWIPECKFSGSSRGIHPGFFFQLRNKGSGACQRIIKVIYPEEQKQPIAWDRVIGTAKGWVVVRAPLVKAKQNRLVGVKELAEVVVRWCRLGLTEERRVPAEATGNISYPDDRPSALHGFSPEVTTELSGPR
jgi:hypothetical protein